MKNKQKKQRSSCWLTFNCLKDEWENILKWRQVWTFNPPSFLLQFSFLSNNNNNNNNNACGSAMAASRPPDSGAPAESHHKMNLQLIFFILLIICFQTKELASYEAPHLWLPVTAPSNLAQVSISCDSAGMLMTNTGERAASEPRSLALL